MLAFLSLSSIALAQGAPITWTGIDYGRVQVMGSTPFDEPSLFMQYPPKWNGMFVTELRDDLIRRLKREVVVETDHLPELHRAIDPERQIVHAEGISADDRLLSRADIVGRVGEYPPGEGMGLTFIAEQLNRNEARGCFWITWYDRAQLVVHDTERVCAPPGGVGFRNYWFGALKRIVPAMRADQVPSSSQVVQLTEQELAEAQANAEQLATRMETAREVAAARKIEEEKREAERAEQQKQAALAAGHVPGDWVTVHVAPEGLGVLKEAGVEFTVASDQRPQPVRPAPSSGSRSGWSVAAGSRSNASVEQQLADESFDSNKVEILQDAASRETFTCARVAGLLRHFTFDNERVKGACALAPAVIDRQNVHLLEPSFDFSTNFSKVEACYR